MIFKKSGLTVPPIPTFWTYILPCLPIVTNALRKALAQDDEMIFSIPKGRLEDLILGIRHFDEAGLGFPIKFTMRPEYPMMASYRKVGKMIGMDIPE